MRTHGSAAELEVRRLIAGKWAATVQRKLPTPVAKSTGPDSDERWSRNGLWAVAVVIVALLGTTWGMNASYQSVLPASIEEFVALRQSEADVSAAEKNTAATTAQPALPELPTPEEFHQSWPSFRGPDGSGISTHQVIPIEWDVASDTGIV